MKILIKVLQYTFAILMAFAGIILFLLPNHSEIKPYEVLGYQHAFLALAVAIVSLFAGVSLISNRGGAEEGKLDILRRGWLERPFPTIIYGLCIGYLLAFTIGFFRNESRELFLAIRPVACDFVAIRSVVLELDPSRITIKPIMWHFDSDEARSYSPNSWQNSTFKNRDPVRRIIGWDDYEQLSDFAQPTTMIVVTSIWCEDWNYTWRYPVFNFRPLPQELLEVSDTG